MESSRSSRSSERDAAAAESRTEEEECVMLNVNQLHAAAPDLKPPAQCGAHVGDCEAPATPWELTMPRFARQGSKLFIDSISDLMHKRTIQSDIKEDDDDDDDESKTPARDAAAAGPNVKSHVLNHMHKSASEFNKQKRQKMKFIVLLSVIWSCITLVINILLIVEGSLNYGDQCSENLPLWLILTGSLETVILFLGVLTNSGRHGGAFATVYSLTKLGSLAWLIVGAVWVYSMSPDDCTTRVYRWTNIFVSINLAIAAIVIILMTAGAFLSVYRPKKKKSPSPASAQQQQQQDQVMVENLDIPKPSMENADGRKSLSIGSDEFGRRVLLGKTRTMDITNEDLVKSNSLEA
eukprot:TRINITY_DN8245_c0_g1_i1.p1 TRINITY_DN8245_c0_g1~~TRINITY_DN8245_c0_g1_i1.p1  ORF type:complete len:351 (-),score=86.53 TRINITY_DN8245_c0_g1_i1:37-1089(-)